LNHKTVDCGKLYVVSIDRVLDYSL